MSPAPPHVEAHPTSALGPRSALDRRKDLVGPVAQLHEDAAKRVILLSPGPGRKAVNPQRLEEI